VLRQKDNIYVWFVHADARMVFNRPSSTKQKPIPGYSGPNSKPMVYAINMYSAHNPLSKANIQTTRHSTYKKYAAPPNPAITTPDHQSALRSMRWRSDCSKLKFLLIWRASLLSGSTISTGIALFALDAFPVAFPVAFAVGFMVVVGSIWGGLKARNMGFIGEPSNL
jgi:hypothetical protein